MSAHRPLTHLPCAALMLIALAACSSDTQAPSSDVTSEAPPADVSASLDGQTEPTDTAIDGPEQDTGVTSTDTGTAGADTSNDEDAEQILEEVASPETDAESATDSETDDGDCEVNADCEALAADMPCHVSVCEFGDCLIVQLSDNIACDDGNPCTAEDTCTAGVCDGVEDLEAEGCANVKACTDATAVTTLPFTDSATTIGGSGFYTATDCIGSGDGKGATSNDALYLFTPETTGTYTFTLSDLGGDPEGLDAVLYLVDGCPALATSACLGAQDILEKNGTEEITVALEAGLELFVVVDGHSSSEGNFELVITQGQSP